MRGEVSSPFLNPGQQKSQLVDWARLIPGETPAFRREGKKPAQSVKPFASEKVSEIATEVAASAPSNAVTLLLPGPLQSPMAWKWVRSMAADFALVALNWLLIGALQVPLRVLFPMCGSSSMQPERPFLYWVSLYFTPR
jgi:hypothetical protein